MSKQKNKYTSEQVDFVKKLVEEGMNVTPATVKMCETFEIKYNESIGRLFRQKMQDSGITNNVIDNPEQADEFKIAMQRQYDNDKKRFIITWAQVDTDVHNVFWENILAYSEKINAGIHVIAGRYKNPTSLEASKKVKENEDAKQFRWDKKVLPYLDANRQKIHELLTICSDIKIQPTAATPLSGLNGITSLESCIIGHPRVHMDSLPVLDGYPNKIICSTGSVTINNYTDTKSGKKGEFHHQLGFVIVELDGDVYHLRQIQADDFGNFYDLKYCVKDGKVSNYTENPLGMVFGDLHIGEEDENAVNTSLKMAKDLNVKKIVLHDIFNGHSISHHEKKDPFLLLQREIDGSNSLKLELKQMKDWISGKPFDFVVVRSNHDDFLDRWLMNEDWRKGTNRFEYLKYANVIAEGKAPKGIIPYVLEKKFKNVRALGINDSYRIGDFECGMHGHIGSGGSRGSAIQFKNLNTKNITGHTHTPKRVDGHMCVGTLTKLRVGYNNGASSWMHANVIIYPNGKASHINIINDKYTTMY